MPPPPARAVLGFSRLGLIARSARRPLRIVTGASWPDVFFVYMKRRLLAQPVANLAPRQASPIDGRA
jgi:hypothetical protein